MKTPQTVVEFADACRGLSNDGIYDMFEFEIADELRDEILLAAGPLDVPEPVRTAFNAIGKHYDIDSLIAY
jgi:hypothetical protein